APTNAPAPESQTPTPAFSTDSTTSTPTQNSDSLTTAPKAEVVEVSTPAPTLATAQTSAPTQSPAENTTPGPSQSTSTTQTPPSTQQISTSEPQTSLPTTQLQIQFVAGIVGYSFLGCVVVAAGVFAFIALKARRKVDQEKENDRVSVSRHIVMSASNVHDIAVL
ncbi:hypothetical protein THRCLA_04236, partial [Thraustotheca clavata]